MIGLLTIALLVFTAYLVLDTMAFETNSLWHKKEINSVNWYKISKQLQEK